MSDIIELINEFNKQHGETLERVIMPEHLFDLYQLSLKQMLQHIVFESDNIHGLILVQKDPN
jgi:hypothetical protein